MSTITKTRAPMPLPTVHWAQRVELMPRIGRDPWRVEARSEAFPAGNGSSVWVALVLTWRRGQWQLDPTGRPTIQHDVGVIHRSDNPRQIATLAPIWTPERARLFSEALAAAADVLEAVLPDYEGAGL